MLNRFRKNINLFISLMVLIAIIFSCQIGIWNTFFSVAISQTHMMESVSKCCETNSANAATISLGNINKDLFTLPETRWFFIVIFYSILFITFKLLLELFKPVIINYFRITRSRYGGFKLFYYLSDLFSSGIIHPKIY